jgi:hypothetical protein
VALILRRRDGSELRQATLFTGDPPPHREVTSPTPNQPQQVPANAQDTERVKAELARQIDRNKQLEKAVEDLRKLIQREQQRRLGAQIPDTSK